MRVLHTRSQVILQTCAGGVLGGIAVCLLAAAGFVAISRWYARRWPFDGSLARRHSRLREVEVPASPRRQPEAPAARHSPVLPPISESTGPGLQGGRMASYRSDHTAWNSESGG